METQSKGHPPALHLAALALGKLKPEQAARIQLHLDGCDECRRYLDATPKLELADIVRRAKKATAEQNTQATGLSGTVTIPPAASPQSVSPFVPTPSSQAASDRVEHELAEGEIPRDLYVQTKYRIIRLLGRGGMGSVYEAEHLRMKRRVAIKTINPDLMQHPQALARFEEEVKTIAALDHPNIARAFDAESFGSVHAIVMEYLDGQTLQDFLTARGRLTVVEACRCVRQAFNGLQYAHQKGLVHRDMKPQNLLLTRDTGMVKILDFGLAKVVRENRQSRGLTSANATMGTFAYMAPEQALDAANADIRADIYSLGCTLYYLLAGVLPFEYETCAKLLLAHQNELAEPLHVVRPDVPEALSNFVSRMLAKNPADRPQTPREAADALLPFAQGGKAAPPIAAAQIPAVPIPPVAKAAVPTDEEPTLRTNAWGWGGLAAASILVICIGGWAAGLFSVRTEHGSIVVDRVPADAVVSIDGEEVTLTRNGESVTISSVATGPHRLKILRGGHEIFSNDVSIDVGGQSVRVDFEADKSVVQRAAPPPERVTKAVVQPPAESLKWADLVETPPRFLPLEGEKLAALQEDRANTLHDVSEYDLESILRAVSRTAEMSGTKSPVGRPWSQTFGGSEEGFFGPRSQRVASTPPASRSTLELPMRFVVRGDFAGLRVLSGQTWIALSSGGQISAGVGLIPTSALIAFDGAAIADSLSDMEIGTPMNVVVNGRKEVPLASATGVSGQVGVYQVFEMQATMNSSGFQSFPAMPGREGRSNHLMAWVVSGEAIEKRNDPATWTHPATNVMRQLANRDEFVRSPSQMVRNSASAAGVEGRISGKLVRLSLTKPAPFQTTPPETLIAHIRIDVGEGRFSMVEAQLGTNIGMADFTDYAANEPVEAAVRFTDLVFPVSLTPMQTATATWNQLQSASQRSQGLLYPLTEMAQPRMQCLWIQKRGQQSSMVTPQGRVEPITEIPASITPEFVASRPEQAAGKKVQWSGKIESIEASERGTHVVIDLSRDTHRLSNVASKIDAFTDAPDFVDELDDYKTESELGAKASEVLVEGTILRADQAVGFASRSIPLQIESIQRTGEAGSRAVPRTRRAEHTFAPDRVSPFVKLFRAMPAVGSEVQLVAKFSRFDESEGTVTLNDIQKGQYQTVEVKFARANKGDFVDYHSEAVVEVSARVGSPDTTGARPKPQLIGLRIARRGNRLSEITDQGRAVAAREFILEKQRWSKLERGRRDMDGESAFVVGEYNGYSSGGSYVSIKLERLFNDYGSAVIICEMPIPITTEALKKLKVGDEIIVHAKLEAADYDRTFHLVSLARVDEPDRAILGMVIDPSER